MNGQHDDAMLDLVAVYALGGVDATSNECALVRQHLAECDTCREEFKIARAAAAAIGLSAAEAPPPSLRNRVLSSLPAQSAASTLTSLRPQRRPRWFIPAAVAAAIVIAWWNVHRTPQQSWAAVCVPAAVRCHASGTVTVAGDRLRMQVNGLSALPAGKQYQAWVIPPGGAPKPEPVFSADDRGMGSVDIPEAPVKGALVAVTVEPAGGSQQPTSKPFLIAKID